MANRNVPDILKQQLCEVKGTSKNLISVAPKNEETRISAGRTLESFENGRLLLRKGVETGLFFVTGSTSPGVLYIFDYRDGTENARLILDCKFGRTAVIADVVYFPLSKDKDGVIVAVADRSMDKYGDYIAYISLETKRILKTFYLQYPITTLCPILDGKDDRSQFLRLAEQFHNDWSHILLVGCRYGYVSLVHLDISESEQLTLNILKNVNESPSNDGKISSGVKIQPTRCKRNIHLSKIFYEDQMFVFRADDGVTRCQSKEKVSVSALHWIEKPGLALIGFNFGGIMIISLRTSCVYSLQYIDGLVQSFAVQEPEEDPRPILYLWIAYNSLNLGTIQLLCTINFPKDEEATKNSNEYTYLVPYFTPCMKWNPDNCTKLITMRTIYMQRRTLNQQNNTEYDTSLLFTSWIERNKRGENIHGAIFDLNAFYAKRLIPKIQPDSTIAHQIPFIARFSSTIEQQQTDHYRINLLLDIMVSEVSQFAPPAFLNETIDQLYYPSTFYLKIACLTSTKIFQAKVSPIQIQLITHLAQDIAKYFESPHESARWIHSIGLANSVPSNNMNEERACLLRVIVHSYFPGILSLVDAAAENPEWIKFIQKWVWKEIELTKTKFDDFCSPLFSLLSNEPSPSARGFIQHARVFFKRASIIFQALNTNMSKLAEHERSRSIVIQGKVARQLRLYSSGVAFALLYNLLPVNKLNSQLYASVIEQFYRRFDKLRKTGKTLEIHTLIDQIIQQNPNEEIWQGKTALEWYPPRDFNSFLPILLLLNITEQAKLTVLGYYCLDIEAATTTFGANIESKDSNTPPSSLRITRTSLLDTDVRESFRDQKYFSLFISFFLQEDFTIEEMDRIKALWLEDKEAAEIASFQDMSLDVIQEQQNGDKNWKLKYNSMGTAEEIRQCKDECLKMDWGIYKFNEIMLDRKNYNYLLDLPPLRGNEPEFAQNCYAKCLEIRRRYPSLFKQVASLPNFIVDQYKKQVRQTQESNLFAYSFQPYQNLQKQPVLPISIKHASMNLLPESTHLMNNLPAKKPYLTAFAPAHSDEETEYEELPLTIATPRKRQCFTLLGPSQEVDEIVPESTSILVTQPSTNSNVDRAAIEKSPTVICNIINKESLKAKDWDRISKVTQTPLSLRKSINQSRLPLRQQRLNLRDRARTTLFQNLQNKPNDQTTNADAQPVSNTTPLNGQCKPRQIMCDTAEISPEPSTMKPQPPSILKSDKRTSRLPEGIHSSRPRLRFAQSLYTTEQIPSRIEKAIDDRHNNSLSNFTTFSASGSSGSSGSKLFSGSGNSSIKCVTDSTPIDVPIPIALKFGEPMDEVREEKEMHPIDEQDMNQVADRLLNGNEKKRMHLSCEQHENEVTDKLVGDNEQQQHAIDIVRNPLPVNENKDEAKETENGHKINVTTTNQWLQKNLRRSSRKRKVTEHFDPSNT